MSYAVCGTRSLSSHVTTLHKRRIQNLYRTSTLSLSVYQYDIMFKLPLCMISSDTAVLVTVCTLATVS